ncbi:glycosyltransferase family 2 protein [Qipengyuania sediminis]|uniref:glycosyltransferase family 2 protein n=1 Tax=Qipengyuania sediminis TaxID=1532023 RepID=UPI00105A1E62|nr:glycosyltransferase family 2 protein [Qipengyuania sediminis]
MSESLSIIAWILAGGVAVPLTVLIVEVAAGLPPGRKARSSGGAPRIAIIIPAHDEAQGIAATLAALEPCTPAGTRVVVVADNCSDDTAGIARLAGVEAIERHDPGRRGKGFALAYGRDHLARGVPPDAVIVLDADCRFGPGSVAALAEAAMARGAPAQAVNLIAPDSGAAPMVQISSFAMVVKNLFRSRGMQRLGGAALLTGTGMAFPWSLFAEAQLATGSIVEDLSLGIELTRAGHPPLLVEEAQVRSAPAAMQDALQQKRRWEHGFLETLHRRALPVLGHGLRRGAWPEILLGLHLIVPPLALLVLVALLALFAAGGLAVLGASTGPALFLAALLAMAAILIGAAWVIGGREYLSSGALLRAPLYVLWKLPIYTGFLKKPQASWNRTPRRD